MLETSFFPFLTLFLDVSNTNLALYTSNVFILYLSKVFCSVVKCYSTLCGRMHFLLPMQSNNKLHRKSSLILKPFLSYLLDKKKKKKSLIQQRWLSIWQKNSAFSEYPFNHLFYKICDF